VYRNETDKRGVHYHGHTDLARRWAKRDSQNSGGNLVFGLFVAGVEPLKGVWLQVGVLLPRSPKRLILRDG